jgi:hypothetical protein
LARKAGLFGSTEEETALIDQFVESWLEIVNKARGIRLLKQSDPEKYAEEHSKFVEITVKPILARHEEALAKNGTGHYIGDKVNISMTALYSGHLELILTTSVCTAFFG